ncbi:hypothetical protein D3C84_784640 [compost metagenome]
MIAERSCGRAVALLPTYTGYQVDGRQVPTFGDFCFFVGDQSILGAGEEFGVFVQGALDRVRERHGLDLRGSHGKQNAGPQGSESAHFLSFSMSDSCFLAPKNWRKSMANRFRLVTSELRTTLEGAKKNFSHGLSGKILMHSSEIQDIFLPADRMFWGFQAPLVGAKCGQAHIKELRAG